MEQCFIYPITCLINHELTLIRVKNKLESTFIEIINSKKSIVSCVYKYPNMDVIDFNYLINQLPDKILKEQKQIFLLGDFKINLLNYRNNLRIDGIEEEPNETWEECEENVQQMIKEKLGITEPIEIDRCHRISKQKKPNRPRTVICRITKFKDKQKILKNAKHLKGSGIYIYEGFCKETIELRKTLWDQVLEYRRQNKFAYLNYRSIVVRDQENDRVVR